MKNPIIIKYFSNISMPITTRNVRLFWMYLSDLIIFRIFCDFVLGFKIIFKWRQYLSFGGLQACMG